MGINLIQGCTGMWHSKIFLTAFVREVVVYMELKGIHKITLKK